MLLLIPILALFGHTQCLDYRISKNFENYLVTKYGEAATKKIIRPSLKRSSMGGGAHQAGHRTNKVPVIFIHGLGGRAGDYESIHKEFVKNGYTPSELYAMTWGKPGTLFIFVDFKCGDILNIRRFIESVSEFTNSKVDVIGYSMGSPLLRKAILGGTCVDNPRINLGQPITNRIQTFVSTGGANYGSTLCKTFASAFCNQLTGLHCRSRFIQDINSRVGYEGSEVYSIFNPLDEWIGDRSVCGVQPFRLNGAEHIKIDQTSHYGVLWKSAPLQVQLISRKYAVARILADIRSKDWRAIEFLRNKHARNDAEVIASNKIHSGNVSSTTKRMVSKTSTLAATVLSTTNTSTTATPSRAVAVESSNVETTTPSTETIHEGEAKSKRYAHVSNVSKAI